MRITGSLTIATMLAAFALTTPALADWREDFDTVRFGILSGENEKDRIARYEPLRDYLIDELGVDVEIFTASSYDGVIQAMAGDQIEVAFHGSSSYAAAYTETEGGVTPILTRQDDDGATGYYSKIYVRCDSGIEDIAGLEGKTFAFADPDSTSGYAVPYFNLVENGIDPQDYFAATPFSGAHESGIVGLVNGQYDAAVTWFNSDVNNNVQRMVDKGMIDAGEVCDVWTSPEITTGPVTVRNNLPDEMVEDIKAALIAFPEADNKAFKEIFGENRKGFIEVDHERYQWIVDMREKIRELRRERG